MAARVLLPLGITLVVAVGAGCIPSGSHRPLADVLKSHTPELMGIEGVVGTGEGKLGDQPGGRPVILVLVARRTPEIDARIPKEIEGYPVEIRAVGEVRKLDQK
jgi:hypothetical protein